MPRQKVKIAPATRKWLEDWDVPNDDARRLEIRAMFRVCEAVRFWAQYDGLDCDEGMRLRGSMVDAIEALERISAGRKR